MTVAFVLGNGISRKSVNLQRLAELGPVYGCNRLYQEFTPTALVATDRPIASEIQESGYSGRHRFHTRQPIPGLGAKPVPKPYYGSSSGPICASLAALDGHQCIYLLGYDMGPAENGLFNNVYANTPLYKKSTDQPTFTGNWIKQLRQVVNDFGDRRWIRVRGTTTAKIPELENIASLSHMPLDQFLELINNGKDL
jgi:hypothetical protein